MQRTIYWRKHIQQRISLNNFYFEDAFGKSMIKSTGADATSTSSSPATTTSNDNNKKAAADAIKLAQDKNASLYEVVYAVPAHQKIAVFVDQRKRFANYEHAALFVSASANLPPLGTHLAILKGTLEEVACSTMAMPYEKLIDVCDDYDGNDPDDCDWFVVGYNLSTKEFFELRNDEEFAFSTREAAIKCARFISNNCMMIDRDNTNERIAVTDGARKNCFLMKLSTIAK